MAKVQVGHQVLFWPGRQDILFVSTSGDGMLAFVCYVFENGKVNLRVFDQNGVGYPRTSISVLGVDEEADAELAREISEIGHCRPMVLQVQISLEDGEDGQDAQGSVRTENVTPRARPKEGGKK